MSGHRLAPNSIPGSRQTGWKAGAQVGWGIYEGGGMGEVYRARDTKLQRDVALKVLPDTMARDAQRMARSE